MWLDPSYLLGQSELSRWIQIAMHLPLWRERSPNPHKTNAGSNGWQPGPAAHRTAPRWALVESCPPLARHDEMSGPSLEER